MNTQTLRSYIVFRKELALLMGVNVLISLMLLLASIYTFKSNFLAVLFTCTMILPLFVLGWVMRIFRRQISINLNQESFLITIKKDNDKEGVSLEYHLAEIKSYGIQFPNRRFSVVKINFKNGKSNEYSFLNERVNEDQSVTKDLINSFQLFIREHNHRLEPSDRIGFKPSFFASKSGLAWIIILACGIAIAAMVHIHYQAKTSPITLFVGVALIIQIMLRRKSDMDYAKNVTI